MSKHARDRRPYIKPVTKIELSGANIKLRWILIILLLLIAAVSLTVGLSSLLTTETGWQEVEATPEQRNCSEDFCLMYDFGESATATYRNLVTLYTDAVENGYAIFTANEAVEGVANLHTVNAHVNEAVTVEEALYKALELVVRYDSRYLFLAPVNVEYNRALLAENDEAARQYSPLHNADVAADVSEMMTFIADPDMISLELLGNNQVRLNVSQEYLAYAQENAMEKFVDFGWMTNAFIIDYMAELLADAGFTDGYLSSYDGFTRNLDARGNEYTFNIFDRQGSDLYQPVRMSYDRPTAIVFLRNYPMTEADVWNYYSFEDGQILTAFVDQADGISKSATDNLVSYSHDTGCAEILLQTAPIFIADALSGEALNVLSEDGIYTIWFEDKTLMHNDPTLKLTANLDGGAEAYNLP